MNPLLKAFFSEPNEFHSFWFGFYSIFHRLDIEGMTDVLRQNIYDNYNYFTFGQFTGYFISRAFINILALCIGIIIGFYISPLMKGIHP